MKLYNRIIIGVLLSFGMACSNDLETLKAEAPKPSLQTTGTYGIRIGYLWINPEQVQGVLTEAASSSHNNYYNNLTHVIIAFANPVTNTGNSIAITDDAGNPILSQAQLAGLVANLKAKKSNLRIGLAIGGGAASGSLLARYTTVLNNASYRSAFINSIISLCESTGIHFVDIDLEWKALTIAGYNTFVQQLYDSGKLRNPTINLTLTLEYKYPQGLHYYNNQTSTTLSQLVTTATLQKCDLLNIMSYDYNANSDAQLPGGIKYLNHSPYDIAKRDVEYFLGRGVPSSKIVLGIPFYGRSAYSGNSQAEINEFSDVLTEIRNVGGTNYYFNGSAILNRKFQLAKDKNIGGYMFWSVRSDKMANYNGSLLKYIVTNN